MSPEISEIAVVVLLLSVLGATTHQGIDHVTWYRTSVGFAWFAHHSVRASTGASLTGTAACRWHLVLRWVGRPDWVLNKRAPPSAYLASRPSRGASRCPALWRGSRR